MFPFGDGGRKVVQIQVQAIERLSSRSHRPPGLKVAWIRGARQRSAVPRPIRAAGRRAAGRRSPLSSDVTFWNLVALSVGGDVVLAAPTPIRGPRPISF